MEKKITTFEDLQCWKSARDLRVDISQLIKTFPEHEKYDLISQMRRASRSVTYNIAEGYGRFHFKENAQFVRTSRGSLYELLDQLIISLEENYINETQYNNIRFKILTTIKIVNGYINYLISKEN